MSGSTAKPMDSPAATDKIPGANAVDASFPHRISSNEVSVTGPWLFASDRSLTVDYLGKKRVWDKGAYLAARSLEWCLHKSRR
jgi:hypothetical protein